MLYSKWMKLGMETRQKLASQFGIGKVGSIEVSDNKIVKDGYSYADIESKITTETLQKFLNSKSTNFDELWTATVDLMENRIPELQIEPEIIIEEMPEEEEVEEVEEVVEKKPKKKNAKTKTKTKK